MGCGGMWWYVVVCMGEGVPVRTVMTCRYEIAKRRMLSSGILNACAIELRRSPTVAVMRTVKRLYIYETTDGYMACSVA